MKIITTRHRWLHISFIGALLLTMLMPTTAIAADPSTCGTTYTVQSGDTLSGIAVFCGVPLATLEQANPQISNYNLIFPGEQITIPQAVIPITGATIAISPVSGNPGSQVTVTGSDFPANQTVNITAAPAGGSASVNISTTTDVNGNFSTSLTIPSSAVAGSPWTITATASTSGGPSASVNFQVIEAAPVTGYYTVQSGDTLSGIALKFNTTINALLRANPDLNNSTAITVGEQLAIPGSLVTSNGQTIYIVKQGDYLSAIAVAQGISLSALEQANTNISDYSLIYPGERIVIPSSVIPITGVQVVLTPLSGVAGTQVTINGANFPTNIAITVSVGQQGQAVAFTLSATTDSNGKFSVSATIPSTATPGSLWTITAATQTSGGPTASANFQVTEQPPAGLYTVQSGDTLSGLALRFNTTISALQRANPQIVNPNVLTVGQQLYIPGSLVTVNGQTIYIVKSGDYLSLIAAEQGITLAALEQANPGITNPNLIYPGEHVVIP
jgi:peptidoglycan endopeptidase LytF